LFYGWYDVAIFTDQIHVVVDKEKLDFFNNVKFNFWLWVGYERAVFIPQLWRICFSNLAPITNERVDREIQFLNYYPVGEIPSGLGIKDFITRYEQ